MAHQAPRVPAGMGDIAAAATADQHLAQGRGGGFKQQHLGHTCLGRRDRRHETSRPAASDHQIPGR
jgi:hypothetical protein